MKKRTPTTYAQILHELLLDVKDDSLNKTLKTYVSFLSKEKALGKIKDIVKSFEKLEHKESSSAHGVLYLANKTSEYHIGEIKKQIKEILKVENLFLEEKVDKDLIAGWKLKTENYLVDGSLSGRISKLRQAVTK